MYVRVETDRAKMKWLKVGNTLNSIYMLAKVFTGLL